MKALWWIIGIIAAVAVVWWLTMGEPAEPSASASPSSSAYVTEAPASASNTPSAVATPVSGIGASGTAVNPTYSALVNQYEDKRIQFDIGCQAIPKLATFKTGTRVMFDNRSGDARTIVINGTSYKFAGYGYWLITLTSPTLPKTFYIDCGAGQNTGTITIQK